MEPWAIGLPRWWAPSGLGQPDPWPEGRIDLAHLLFQNTKHIMWRKKILITFLNQSTNSTPVTHDFVLCIINRQNNNENHPPVWFLPKENPAIFFAAHQPLSLLSLHPRGLLFPYCLFFFLLKDRERLMSHYSLSHQDSGKKMFRLPQKESYLNVVVKRLESSGGRWIWRISSCGCQRRSQPAGWC